MEEAKAITETERSMSNIFLNKTEIESRLSALMNIPAVSIGRAGFMMWIALGKELLHTNERGKEERINEFALHICCPWRFMYNGSCILGNGDFFEPSKALLDSPKFEWKNFDCSPIGNNLFDETRESFIKKYLNADVNGITVDSLGGFTLELKNGVTFQTFINSMDIHENWRMIRFGKSSEDTEHFVVFD